MRHRAAPTTAKPKRQRKAPAEPKEKKVSALDAAAKVLAEEGRPMTCKELITAMAAKGYWTSPGGQTPDATLYSAILREVTHEGRPTPGSRRRHAASSPALPPRNADANVVAPEAPRGPLSRWRTFGPTASARHDVGQRGRTRGRFPGGERSPPSTELGRAFLCTMLFRCKVPVGA